MKDQQKNLILIILITALCLVIDVPKDYIFSTNIFNKNIKVDLSRPSLDLKIGNFSLRRDFDIKRGLDLLGGMQVTLTADMSKINNSDREAALESVRSVISRRVDLYGVAESSIKTLNSGGNYRLIVELPGVEDPTQAISLIGQTAKLQFALPQYKPGKTASDAATFVGFSLTDLTGSDLKKASVSFETEDRSPAVAISFQDSGKDKFAKLTKENINKPIAILLDGYPITMPVVQTEIADGNAQITGKFTTKEAKSLAVQLDAGALPVPINIEGQKNIPPSLGVESVQKSLVAGGVGLASVIIFMSVLYGRLGVIASAGLVIYGLITLALYKLIPVTLSLPGIAGFILSVGMAVDSNILIFERYKEEIRSDRNWQVALELAFGRAWDSIRDANTTTILTGIILFNPLNWEFLNVSGLVRGFAFTLILGIIVSLFTGIFVTRNLLRVFYKGQPKTTK